MKGPGFLVTLSAAPSLSNLLEIRKPRKEGKNIAHGVLGVLAVGAEPWAGPAQAERSCPCGVGSLAHQPGGEAVQNSKNKWSIPNTLTSAYPKTLIKAVCSLHC